MDSMFDLVRMDYINQRGSVKVKLVNILIDKF